MCQQHTWASSLVKPHQFNQVQCARVITQEAYSPGDPASANRQGLHVQSFSLSQHQTSMFHFRFLTSH